MVKVHHCIGYSAFHPEAGKCSIAIYLTNVLSGQAVGSGPVSNKDSGSST